MKVIITVFAMGVMATGAIAQLPPATVQWMVVLPYGSEQDVPAHISVDHDTTYWMVRDDNMQWTTQDGVIRRYDPNGLALNGYSPDARSIGCNASLDRPIAFHVRNDSIWGISYWQYLGGTAQDITFCAQGPGDYHWSPDAAANGAELWDRAVAMAVDGTDQLVLAQHQVNASVTDGRLIRIGITGTPLWDEQLPVATYGETQAMVVMPNDSLGVAAFPLLHWFQSATGTYSSTDTLYSGAAGPGRIIFAGDALYWAAQDNGTVRYGKLGNNGSPVWTGSAPGITVMALAVDGQQRLWIGGHANGEGKVIKVEADGALDGTYTFGASITDLDFSNGRLSFTGRWLANAPSTFLINTIPQP